MRGIGRHHQYCSPTVTDDTTDSRELTLPFLYTQSHQLGSQSRHTSSNPDADDQAQRRHIPHSSGYDRLSGLSTIWFTSRGAVGYSLVPQALSFTLPRCLVRVDLTVVQRDQPLPSFFPVS